ncbi:VanZ family protein [Paenarthrobacter histidinolovorans]|uniref:VanZ family protein n=1 Tax=Paenarthrobacter histidinolovorans TaxID=43664 RepID=UPI00166AFAEE|nr:VanZ family protein [Paenarthrobacter histidinolovorans]
MKQHPFPWRIASVFYLLSLAVIGFWPTPVDKPINGALTSALKYLHRLGVPGWFDYRFVEASANVAMFIPFGALLAMALPTQTWWKLASSGLLASICIELGQLLFTTARVPSLGDVVTNTLGAMIGIVGSRFIRRSADPKRAEA